MVTKREDPAYSPLRGHVPKELYKRFKAYCVEEEMDNSEALENVLKFYFEYRDELAPKSDIVTACRNIQRELRKKSV